jgi:hypothetical protein
VVPIKVIHKVTFSFTPYPLCFHPPYPLFPQSKEILLNLSTKCCWNSALNAQGSSSENVCSSSGGAQEGKKGETQFGGKTSLGPSYFVFAKFHFQLRISCLIMTKLAILDPLIAWLYG